MAIDKDLIESKRAIVRLSFQGRVRYGLYSGGRIRLYEGSPFAGGKPGSQYAKMAEATLLAPCRPSKVVAIGLNYKAHAAEFGKTLPNEPMIFMKPSTSVIGPGQYIVRPKSAGPRVDYEAELAVVMGRKCKDAEPEQVADYVLGYTCLNDVTERHMQKRDGQYTRGKGFDTFCPIGPAIALDLDPNDVRVRSFVNGEAKQDTRTSDMIFPPAELVSFISKVMTLNPGDVIATGTPAGVGPVIEGDSVEIRVQGIGRLINPVRQA